jgi:multiple sugar transport system permease protein/raffinose/stachyose/melibiose transport system permease protein
MRKLKEQELSRTRWGLVSAFVGPALLFYLAFTVYPVVRTILNSFYEIRPRGRNTFLWFDNYVALYGDATFWTAVVNTLAWAVIVPILETALGLALALCIYAGTPFARFFRTAWFAPALISYVVVAIMWNWLLNYDWGLVNQMLEAVGLPGQPWLSDPDLALGSLMFVDVWKWTGFSMIVCLAALHSLPSEVLEAAELDNCGWLQKTWFIVMPMIAPTLVGLVVLGFIGKMKVFDLVWIMTQGGPLWSTETVSTYVYKRAFSWSTFDLGYPSTIATVWFLVILVCVVLVTAFFRRRDRLEF